jgi:hypothetical protein
MKTAVQIQLADRQLALLYSAIPNSLIASIFGSVVAELIFRDVINPYRLWTWIGLMAAVSAFRIWDFLNYRRNEHGVHNHDQWFLRFRIGALLQAFAVGSGGLLLFAFDDSSYQMLLALMMV